jgi:proline iminopeptidase
MLLIASAVSAHDGLPSGYANVNGVDIYYETDGSGIPILLMHGGPGGDHWNFHWPGAIPPLADSYKLIYYDHRANGRSGGDPNTVTYENLSKDAESLRQFLGLGKVIVMGHSWGGVIALHYALNYPNSVAAIIELCGGVDLMLPFGDIPPGAENRSQDGYYFFSEEKWLEYKKVNQTIMKSEQYAVFNESFNATSRLNEIKVPTLVLEGKYDYAWRMSDTEAMAKGIQGSKFVIFDKSGHMPFVEEPELFQKTVREFLGGVFNNTTNVSSRNSIASTWGSIKSIK